jgi:membrane-associated protease RseP (regulator of RpoE activity)
LVEDSKKASGYLIGISFGTQKETLPFSTALDATWAQTTGTMELIPKIPLQMYKSVKSIFTHEPRGNGSMISIVGVGQIAVDQTTSTNDFSQQVGSILMLLASLNIALFVMNLIPLLPLDGGHILNALYEGVKRTVYKIRGKKRPAPADLARSMPVGVVVCGLLILMFVVTIVVDIVNPVKI